MEFTYNTFTPSEFTGRPQSITVYCERHEKNRASASGPGHRAYSTVGDVEGLEWSLTEDERDELLSGSLRDQLEEQANEAHCKDDERARAAAENQRWSEYKETRESQAPYRETAAVG